MRGRKPLPTQLKKLSGTYRHDRGNPDEPALEPCLPRAPGHLVNEAKKCWARAGKVLLAARVMTAADWITLSMLCSTWARHVEAEAKVLELGAVVRGVGGGAVVSPWVHVSQKAIEQCTKLAIELGMTPSARARVKIVGKGEDVSKEPLAILMAQMAAHR